MKKFTLIFTVVLGIAMLTQTHDAQAQQFPVRTTSVINPFQDHPAAAGVWGAWTCTWDSATNGRESKERRKPPSQICTAKWKAKAMTFTGLVSEWNRMMRVLGDTMQ
jgi:hypothetical protein